MAHSVNTIRQRATQIGLIVPHIFLRDVYGSSSTQPRGGGVHGLGGDDQGLLAEQQQLFTSSNHERLPSSSSTQPRGGGVHGLGGDDQGLFTQQQQLFKI
jgi:hypothetical protein